MLKYNETSGKVMITDLEGRVVAAEPKAMGTITVIDDWDPRRQSAFPGCKWVVANNIFHGLCLTAEDAAQLVRIAFGEKFIGSN